MRRRIDLLFRGFQIFVVRVLTALSFVLLPVNFGYIVYYQFVCYDMCRVLVGCVSLYIMIHLNKSL